MFSRFFKILNYSEENLAEALETKYFPKGSIIAGKFHYKFLIEYLGKQNLLFTSLPKYVWVAEASVHEIKIPEFLYDSTDMAHGLYCIGFNCFSENI